MAHILIVEDETIIRSALRRLLERNQYQVSEAGSVQEAQERYTIPSFDMVVSDLRLPGAPGTELIKLAEGIPVLIMTSYASLRSAVDSMKMGAVDYIAKPFDHDEMLQAVARILKDRQENRSAAPVSANGGKAGGERGASPAVADGEIGIIGSCAPMQELYSKIRKVAPTDSTVLIQGESGTGKELVARALHNLSKRAKAPLISVNCAAIPVAASVNPALSPDVPSMAREQGRSVLLSEQVIDLSLSDAVYLGLRNNRGIRSAYLQRIAQKFDLRVAADAFNPKLVVRGDYRANRATEDRTRTSNVSPTATLLGEYGTRFSLAWVKQFRTADEAGRYRSDGLDLTVVQPLLRDAGWDVTTAPLRLARLSEDANRLQLKASVSQTISQVIGAYRELLRAQEQARIAREALARTQELLEVNRAMIRAGRMAEFEIVQTEADVASQELNVEESTNQVDSARLALLQLLALDLSTQIRASDALAATPIEVDRQQAIRTALQQQPEYLQRLIGSRQADLNLVLAKNQRLWDVSLVGGASQIRDRYSEGGGDNSRSWDSYAGVQVEIPIGDLSRRQAEVRAQVDVENQKILIEDARQTLEQNVIDAVRDLGTRWRQYQIAQRATALSRRKLEIEREKLRVGRSSNFQVLSFETDLRNVENTQLNALISFLNAQTQLDLIVGMTLDSWEISLNDH